MGLKSLWSEFKAFAFKGNMIELAVAVVIGAAFGNVIKAMVDDIIMPSISYVTTAASTAKDAATDAAKHASAAVGIATKPADTEPTTAPADAAPPAPPAVPAPPAPAPPAPAGADKPVNFDWTIGRFLVGKFVAELLNFLLIAFAVFIVIVKLLGSVMKKVGGTPAPSEPTTRECPECLSVIPLRAKRCPNCTSVVAPVVVPPAVS